MWAGRKRDNYRDGVPEEFLEKYPLLYNGRMAGFTRAFRGELEPFGTAIPLDGFKYRMSVNGDIPQYMACLATPLLFNGISLRFISNIYLPDDRADWIYEHYEDFDLNIYVCSSGRFESYTEIPAYTELIGFPTYIHANELIIHMPCDDCENVYKYYHKIIAVANAIITKDKELPYPYPTELFDELYNYRMPNWITMMCAWLDTFYNNLIAQQRDRTLKYICETLPNQRLNSAEKEIQRIKNKIDNYESDLRHYYAQLQDVEVKYMGLKYKQSEQTDVNWLRTFKLCADLKNISYNSENRIISLSFVSPLINYDVELAERWCKEPDNIFAHRNIQDLMYKLLVSGKYTILVQSDINWDLYNAEIRGLPPRCNDYYNNVHLTRFSCFGDNKRAILQALTVLDLPLALDCTHAASASLNLLDGTVLEIFLEHLITYGYLKSIRNNETGELVTLEEVKADDTITRES